MAIYKRISKRGPSYQVKVKSTDGKWISLTYKTKLEAEEKELALLKQKKCGSALLSQSHVLTVKDYFSIWNDDTRGTKASEGWRESQLQMYRDYIDPVIGTIKLSRITPALISNVVQNTKRLGRSNQTCLHVYNLLNKIFRDAVDLHEILERNPVKRNLRPCVVVKEARYLEVHEARRLLDHVRGKTYEVAVWLGVYVGLRVGEVQGLLWENVDLSRGIIYVRRTYVRREKRFKEYPKGKKWHDIAMPPELWEILKKKKAQATTQFVVISPRRQFLAYDGYLKALKRYCREIGLKDLATHALRHSTAEVWIEHGASDADMQMLFAHSDRSVTERYIHADCAKRLGKLANGIRLFDGGSKQAEVH